jgi:saccharopine dehydrogenase (NAD+, L-lysine-forming)
VRVAVLGAGGQIARPVLYDLLRQDDLEKLLLVGRRREGLEKVRDDLEAYNAVLAEIDIHEVEDLARCLEGHDIVVNCAQYYYNMHAMRACLAAHANYVDMGGLYHATLRQVGLDREFQDAGLLAVLGMGSSPGMTNVFARYAVESMDSVSSLSLRSGISDSGTGSLGIFLWASYSLDTLLDQVWLDAPLYRDGAMIVVPPFSGSERVTFPGADHPCEFVYTINSELATLPASFGHRGLAHCDHKEGFPPAVLEKMRILTEAGLIDRTESDFMGIRFAPRRYLEHRLSLQAEQVWNHEDFFSRVWVEASGRKNGQAVTVRVQSGYSSRDDNSPVPGFESGFATAIVAGMMARGLIKGTGVMAPEQCIEPVGFFQELAQRGIRVEATWGYTKNNWEEGSR